MLGFHSPSSYPVSSLNMGALEDLPISLADWHQKWAPRPLITMTISGDTDNYSTESLETP